MQAVSHAHVTASTVLYCIGHNFTPFVFEFSNFGSGVFSFSALLRTAPDSIFTQVDEQKNVTYPNGETYAGGWQVCTVQYVQLS